MSHTKGKCEVVHTNWRTSLLVFGGRIMAECNVDPDFDEDNASDVEAEDAEMEKTANAERIAALWNAAEERRWTTEDIEAGVITPDSETRRIIGRLNDKYENVSRLYSQRGETIQRLEAEKAEMLEALERIRDESGPFNLGEMRKLVESAIRKARGEE